MPFFANCIIFLTLLSLLFLLGDLPPFLASFILTFFFICFLFAIFTTGLGEEVPQTIAEINLNLPTCFNGYLPRAVDKLKEYRFHTVSYSPSTMLLAEHLTEAFTVTSFPGQPMNNKDGPNI